MVTRIAKPVSPAGAPPEPPELEITGAAVLMEKAFQPLIQPVHGFICEGLTMLVAGPKTGKSWLALYMGMCVAEGQPFLDRATTKSRVLYFALEDSERRLQSRLETIDPFYVPPGNLSFATKAATLDAGFLEQLDGWLRAEEGPCLVLIDTLQKVRGMGHRGANAYQEDYETMGKLKAMADKYRTAIVCVHHTNKNKNAIDPYDRISGSMGLMGCADTTILLDRERGQDTATVHFEGRDIYGPDFEIRFKDGRWELEHADAQEYRAGITYEAEPIVQLFRHLIAEHPEGWRGTYSKLRAIGLELLGFQPFIDSRDCARKLNDDGLANELRRRDDLLVECAVQTTGGRGLRVQQIKPIVAFPTKMKLV